MLSKMINSLYIIFIISASIWCVRCDSIPNNTILVGTGQRPPVSGGWIKNAREILAGPAGHVVVQVAKELINRSAGNSQVLSLNLSNLIILILLKALIFIAGLLGAGHWSHFARSVHSNYAPRTQSFDYSGN